MSNYLQTLPVEWVVVTYTLAVARVTGFIVSDSIFDGVRERFLVWLDDRPRTLGQFLADLIGCPWCVSVWISGAIVPLAWAYGREPVMLGGALWLAISQVVGMISGVGRPSE